MGTSTHAHHFGAYQVCQEYVRNYAYHQLGVGAAHYQARAWVVRRAWHLQIFGVYVVQKSQQSRNQAGRCVRHPSCLLCKNVKIEIRTGPLCMIYLFIFLTFYFLRHFCFLRRSFWFARVAAVLCWLVVGLGVASTRQLHTHISYQVSYTHTTHNTRTLTLRDVLRVDTTAKYMPSGPLAFSLSLPPSYDLFIDFVFLIVSYEEIRLFTNLQTT